MDLSVIMALTPASKRLVPAKKSLVSRLLSEEEDCALEMPSDEGVDQPRASEDKIAHPEQEASTPVFQLKGAEVGVGLKAGNAFHPVSLSSRSVIRKPTVEPH